MAAGPSVIEEKKREAEALDSLSAREREVLVLVVEGRTSKEIARIVGVKPTSIDTYRSRIIAKLDVPDLCALVRFAIRQGLVTA
jgi:two-component system invasion response regulator UvrY